MIIIGLGPGRSGTASLAKLLSSQKDSLCFHELNPSCVCHSGSVQPILNTINEFQRILDGGDPSLLTVDFTRNVSVKKFKQLIHMDRVGLLGDVAHYYLNYVEAIVRANSNVRFICMFRDRDATVKSWLRKTSINRWFSKRVADRLSSLIIREPYYKSYNHWMEHDGTKWKKDPVWDKCFPKFEAKSKVDAINKYWEYYYEKANVLTRKLPSQFRIFEVDHLNNRSGQEEILKFCGIDKADRIFTEAHIHKSRKEEPSLPTMVGHSAWINYCRRMGARKGGDC